MKFQWFTPVVLTVDIPALNLKQGSMGTIVEYYPMPESQENDYRMEGLIPFDIVEVTASQIAAIAPLSTPMDSAN